MLTKSLLTIGLFIFSFNAFAFPLPKMSRNFVELPKTFDTNFNFSGIVGLDNCSGSLVRFETSQDSDPALVLSNGHCVETGFIQYGQFLSHRQSWRGFSLLNASAGEVGQLEAAELIYATMTGTDVSIYKLTQTYAEIKTAYGIDALTLTSQHPAIGQNIEVISGYWERGYHCAIEKFVHELDEEGWKFSDSIRYSRPGCEVIGGTSGSPVIAAGTRTVIAINNTGNMNGERCTRDNPCEIDEQGNVFYQQGYSYGQEITAIYTCLNANREIDLTQPGCSLTH